MLPAFYCYKAAGKWLYYSLSISEPARKLVLQWQMRTPCRCYCYKLIKSAVSSSGIVHLCGWSCILHCLPCFALAFNSIHILFFSNQRCLHVSELIFFLLDEMCGQPSPLVWSFGTSVPGTYGICFWSAALNGGRMAVRFFLPSFFLIVSNLLLKEGISSHIASLIFIQFQNSTCGQSYWGLSLYGQLFRIM